MSEKIAFRGSIFTFKESATLHNIPFDKKDESDHYYYFNDGLMIVDSGKIIEVGDYAVLKARLDNIPLVDYTGCLIAPGFIDTHIHATQTGVIAAYGEHLLEWLHQYVFPHERRYQEPDFAERNLNFFLDQLLKNGTTTAMAYGPLYYEATDQLFNILSQRNMRFILGNVLMDRNAFEDYRLPTQENYDHSKKLIEKWHKVGRLSYAVTPRFSLSCSESLLEMAGSLKKAYPDVYVQTHLSENVDEVNAVKEMFPWSANYLDVYDHFGLIGERSVLGHCIHLSDVELERFRERQAIVSWCPISNCFLGSGFFNVKKVFKYTDRISLATDMGAGDSFSMFSVMNAAYKIAMLEGAKLSSFYYWYMATLGAAKALQLCDKIGSLSPGKEADFIVIDLNATELLSYRIQQLQSVFDLLFVVMMLGDDRLIHATYLNGECAYQKIQSSS